MTRHKTQITALILITFAMLLLVLIVYLIGQSKQPRKINLPEIAFLDSTGLAVYHNSENIPPPESRDPVPMEFKPLNRRDIAIQYLDNGKFLLAGWPESFILNADGVQESQIMLGRVPEEMCVDAGIDPLYPASIMNFDNTFAAGATDSGRILMIFAYEYLSDDKDEEMLLIEWDINGNPVSIMDIGPYINPTSLFRYDQYGHIGINTHGEQVLVMTSDGTYFHMEPGREIQHGQITIVNKKWSISGFPFDGGFYTKERLIAPIPHSMDGQILWDRFERVTELLHPVTYGDPSWPPTSFFDDWYIFLDDGSGVYATSEGIWIIDQYGQIKERVGDFETAENLRSVMYQLDIRQLLGSQTSTGWVFYPTRYDRDYYSIITDRQMNVLSQPMFMPVLEEPEVPEVEPAIYEGPDIEVGDRTWPKEIFRDFAVTETGFRGIERNERTVISTDYDLNITSIFNRVNPSDGMYQTIDIYREDSQGNIYIVDKGKNLIQVLDSDGHYIRRHSDLGLDIFGEVLQPRDLQIDALDRVWIISSHRIFVLDRDGYLVRIFENRGAPFTPVESSSNLPPPEERVQGYTIFSTSDPFGGASDPTQPIQLEMDTADWTVIYSPDPSIPVLMFMEDDDTDIIHIIDWEGRELGTIDPELYTSDNTTHFMTGPDGYIYLLCIDDAAVEVLTPLGEHVTRIELNDFPTEDSWFSPGTLLGSNSAFIDTHGRLVIYRLMSDTEHRMDEILIYPLRADDDLQPMDDPQSFAVSVVEEEAV